MTVVVALGQQLTDDALHPHLRRRVALAVELFRRADRFPDEEAWLVFTGARTNPAVDLAESEAMAEYAVSQGVDRDRIRLDVNARDTRENGYFVRRIVDDIADGDGDDPELVRVVSSCVHLERAAAIFEHSFGSDYEIDASNCVDGEANDPEIAITPDGAEGDARADETFYDSVTPGDLGALYERFRRSDEYPDWAARVDPPSA